MGIYERTLIGLGHFMVILLTTVVYLCLLLFIAMYLPGIKVLQWLLLYHYANAMLCETLVFGWITWQSVKGTYTWQDLNDTLLDATQKTLSKVLLELENLRED